MSSEAFPGGMALHHHHSGTGLHCSNSSVLKGEDVHVHILKPPSGLVLPKRGGFYLLPKEREISLDPLDRLEKTRSPGWLSGKGELSSQQKGGRCGLRW